MMHKIETRIFISDNLLEKEYEYMYGDNKNKKVDFVFSNVKTCKDITKLGVFTYKQALELARERRKDKRYKNYEFLIM